MRETPALEQFSPQAAPPRGRGYEPKKLELNSPEALAWLRHLAHSWRLRQLVSKNRAAKLPAGLVTERSVAALSKEEAMSDTKKPTAIEKRAQNPKNLASNVRSCFVGSLVLQSPLMVSESSQVSSRANSTGRRSFVQVMLKSKKEPLRFPLYRKVRGILQLLVSLALLVWLVNRVGPGSIISKLADIDWRWYLFAFLLSLINILLRSYRWYILLNALDDRPPRSGGRAAAWAATRRRGHYGTPPFRQLLYLYFVGFFFNNFIPSGFGGDVVKVLSLRQEHGRGAEALSSVIMDRLTGLIGSSLIALIALAWNSIQPWSSQVAANLSLPPALTASIALISLGVPLGFILVRWADPIGLLASRLPPIQRLIASARLQRLLETIHRYPLPTLLKALLTSIPFTLSLIVTQYSIAQALSVDVPFYLFPLFVPVISIINLLPLSFNGLGMREGVYQFLFVPMGISSASAIAMSLAFYFLRVGTGLVGGLLYAFKSVSGLIQAARTNQMEL